MPLEQRAEAERLFWKRVELSIAAAIAEREHELRRHRKFKPALAHARARVRETRVAAQVLAKELSALQGREPEPHRHRWDTAGQCEGRTQLGERCRVHRSSPYAVAVPLRRGERFCGHHPPDKYTGVRCAGIKKHGKGQCRVWSNSCYADSDPVCRGYLQLLSRLMQKADIAVPAAVVVAVVTGAAPRLRAALEGKGGKSAQR